MGFLGVYRAIYDYAPQSENELEITEGDLLFVLEKSDEDDWWKAKKKANSDEDDEPEGLIPCNYIEEAQPLYQAKALYDYTKQTDEEVSFAEEARLQVFDTTDPDWTLVASDGEYGFAPALYIEEASSAGAEAPAPVMPPRPPAATTYQEPEVEDDSPLASPVQNPAKALAGIIAQKTGQSTAGDRGLTSPPLPTRPQYTPEDSDEEAAPSLPQRPRSEEPVAPPTSRSRETESTITSPSYNRASSNTYDDEPAVQSPRGFHMYNIHEMVSHMGKNKKMPTTLGINVARGLITISPEKAKNGPQTEWTAEKLTHYSIEGKHVFMELVRPSKSADFHAGAKDTAHEIVSALGELAGASRAEGLREVLAATSGTGGGGQKTGHMLYEFMAQGDDEVTVAVGDEIIILDDTKSEEWWMIRRLKNGKEGVVPSSYVEITGKLPEPSSGYTALNAGRSTVEQNRIEEERLTREATKSHKKKGSESRDVGPGMHLPDRQSSLRTDSETRQSSPRKRESRADGKSSSSSKPKPDSSRVRTWTDRTGSFKVEAEFIGLKDGKIHLHKLNGVKIAVPVNKMAVEDLEYVENATGVSLDEDKPLSDIKRRSTQRAKDRGASRNGAGATVDKAPDYDWFDFFLQCGVNPQICERYASAFSRDQMGEEVLPDVQPPLLRTLGLKEGDILRVMKNLDARYGREGVATNDTGDANGSAGGLFSGPGGALRNNTRKGRPAPAVQTNDVVDADAFRTKNEDPQQRGFPVDAAATPLTSAPARNSTSGFDDDAWDVKPSKTPAAATPAPAPASAPAPLPAPARQLVDAPPAPPKPPTGALGDLSLLTPALQPTPAPQPAPQAAAAQPLQPARTGADPSFFDKLAAPAPQQVLQTQPTGLPRQRPMAPPQMHTGGSSIAPPPQRASSAPGFPQQSGFAPPPLQPQLTGYQAQPGQSLQDMQQQRLMQQQNGQQGIQPQMTGFPQQQMGQMQNGNMMPQPTGFNQFQQSPMQSNFPQYQQPQQTGFQASVHQQFMNGQTTGSPFADPPRPPFQSQPTGFQQSFTPQPMQPQQTGFMQPQQTGLPPPLQPQQTGMTGFNQPQQTGMNGFGQPQQTGMNGFGQPQQQPQQFGQGFGSMQPQPTGMQPLVPQKTGPAPSIRFGVQPANKLVAQPTGRANLRNATPQNPFGF